MNEICQHSLAIKQCFSIERPDYIDRPEWRFARFHICPGDQIWFWEYIFAGAKKQLSDRVGMRAITARVNSCRYNERQRLTFNITVMSSEGWEPLMADTVIERSASNLYNGNLHRKIWTDEQVRRPIMAKRRLEARLAAKIRKLIISNDFKNKMGLPTKAPLCLVK